MPSLTTATLVTMLAVGSMAANAADAPSTVYAAYGLTGTWSLACDQPVGPSNPRFSYEPQPNGLVDTVADFGEASLMRSTTQDAVVDNDHRLHVTTETKFVDQLPSSRNAMTRSGKPSDVTYRSILAIGDDGSLRMQDVIMTTIADASTQHVVADGFVLDPATQAQSAKAPARHKCLD